MSALKGNRNGEKTWIKQQGEEPLVALNIRIPKSQMDQLDSLRKPEQSKSVLVREIIAEYLKTR